MTVRGGGVLYDIFGIEMSQIATVRLAAKCGSRGKRLIFDRNIDRNNISRKFSMTILC